MLIFSFASLIIIFSLFGSQLIKKLFRSPLVFPFIFLFTTYIISPVLYHFDLSWFKFWLISYNEHFYTLNYKVFFIFIIYLIFMIIGLKFRLSKSISLPKIRIAPNSAGIAIFISVCLLIYMSKGDIFNNIFSRELAVTYINESGFGRYLLFIPLISFSFPIYLMKFRKFKRKYYFFISVFLYLLLVPFFGITSGRGSLLFPLIMVFFVNFNYISKLSFNKILILSFLFVILMIGLAGLRMGDSFSGSLENTSLVFATISDAFSRFDSTYAALSAFINEDWDLIFGQSYFYGLFQIFPPSFISFRDLTITPFLAKAIHNDIYFDIPSGTASSIIFESYVNLGLFGTIISGILTGYYYRVCYKLYNFNSIEYKVLSFHMAWMNPFGLSFALFFYDIVYKILFPFLFLILLQYILKQNSK